METHSRLHGKSQPRLLQTYLFMKCEVMKKVLNPTTVLTLTVLSRSAGTRGCCPVGPPLPAPRGGDRGLCHPHIPPQAGQRDSTGRGKPRRQHRPPPCTQPAPSSQAPCKAQSFAGDFKWLLVRGHSQGWARGSQGRERGKNPLLLQMGGLESCKGGTGLREDSARGSSRSQPLPDLPKVQQD